MQHYFWYTKKSYFIQALPEEEVKLIELCLCLRLITPSEVDLVENFNKVQPFRKQNCSFHKGYS